MGATDRGRPVVSTLAGGMKQITVLFCGIVNSPPLTKHLAPGGMRDLVTAFLEVSLAEVRRYGAPRRNLEAEGFMALSGAPMTHEEPCPAGALAALGIRRALCEDSDKADAERSALTVRIGIHTGPVVFGPITEKLPMEYTGIGDTANIAARLQQAAEPRMILVSEAVHLLAGGYAPVEPTGHFVLEGRAEPILAIACSGCRIGAQRSIKRPRLIGPNLPDAMTACVF